MLTLFLITLVAATVNGALGYGFSSITVPLALLFLSNRVLNPALVVVEVFLNLYVLIVNRKSFRRIFPKVVWIMVGIAPAVLAGSYLLKSLDISWVKFWTYLTLMPLLFLQVAGLRRPVRLNGPLGTAAGGGVGLLYALTTISGPPLALIFNNDGLKKEDFRAALGIVRVFEATLTAITYFMMGLITMESINLLSSIVPAIVLGVPFGAFLLRRIDVDVFRRVCMTFDVLIVAFGLSRVVQDLHLIEGPAAYSIMLASSILDGLLLHQFFSKRSAECAVSSVGQKVS